MGEQKQTMQKKGLNHDDDYVKKEKVAARRRARNERERERRKRGELRTFPELFNADYTIDHDWLANDTSRTWKSLFPNYKEAHKRKIANYDGIVRSSFLSFFSLSLASLQSQLMYWATEIYMLLQCK